MVRQHLFMKKAVKNVTRVDIPNANMAHISQEKLSDKLAQARKRVEVGGLYYQAR